MGRKRLVLNSGDRFGRWTVLGLDHKNEEGSNCYACKCDCGKTSVVVAYSLKSGVSQSCGCLANEGLVARRRERAKRQGNIEHRKCPIYDRWRAMLARCFNEKDAHYPRWGGRGIKPCAWLAESPWHLLELLGEGVASLQMDRTDNDGGYWCGTCKECKAANHPLNVRLVTAKEQSNNRRKKSPNFAPRPDAVWHEAFGELLTLKQWAERYGLTKSTIKARIKKPGMTLEKALGGKKLPS